MKFGVYSHAVLDMLTTEQGMQEAKIIGENLIAWM